ncbi:filamentous hemagglutinin N-terminal domain-containing protein [Sphaerospermopsis aphanizomenoides BCCUSP55]|uniref:two-partner secretion domain-containing protein n=1 Tax=Sphaerospermopsis aphanizomenoides TaxID=459663 RepID=UPI0019074F03|nr:filamentous hemagglutinin N-terminal domain-containing protein [Sphaerospermopsis aphanizomenoides]MBK1987629.1 filamentous hemagglutinin N-terminal domain-containing protein [Sphaerospermopsis aphanizomenoides BCCUSP55]
MCFGLTPLNSAKAQIIPDGTLGAESSVVTPNQTIKGIPSDRIDGGAIRGGNLFHSFQEFNIESGRGVYFNNPHPNRIENILTRVTGSNVSKIFGTLGVLGNANLFFINPNGIIFGQNASLDIRGSFTATTANEIKLGENGLFSASNPHNSNLLSVQPGALFKNALRNQQAEIINEGNLIVDSGKNITLFGANVINTGTLTARGGTIQLTGTERLQVRGNVETGTLLLDTKNLVITDEFINDKDATLYRETLEELSGNTNLILQATNDFIIHPLYYYYLELAHGNGKIKFTADTDGDGIGNFQMDSADTITANGRNIEIKGVNLTVGNINNNSGLGRGNITLNAVGDITTGNLDSSSLSFLGNAEGGAITLSTSQGNITTGNLDSSSLSFLGNAEGGAITLSTSQGNITTEYLDSSSSSLLGNGGNGGDISLTAKGYIPINWIDASAYGNGNSGRVIINADKVDVNGGYIRSMLAGTGQGGGITINTGSLSVTNLAELNTSVINGGNGRAGDIVINAPGGDVIFDGGFAISRLEAGGKGRAGDILITTDSLLVTGIPSYIADANIGQIVAASFAEGDAGSVIIKASGDVRIDGKGSDIWTLVEPPNGLPAKIGNGGNIEISGRSLYFNNANLASVTRNNIGSSGNAGAITLTTTNGSIIQASDSIYPILSDSYSDSGTAGNAGDITMIANGGDIITQTINALSNTNSGTAGNGGNISLTANGGNITTKEIYAHSNTLTSTGIATAGNGGNISLTANGGNITTQRLTSLSFSPSGTAGNGGNISLTANGGNITTQTLASFSFSPSGTAGNGGDITMTANSGDIKGIRNEDSQIPVYTSVSISQTGTSGKGGNITLEAKNQISDLEIVTVSSDSTSGDVRVKGFGDLSVTNTSIITSKQVTIKTPVIGGEITLDVGGEGQSGNVTVISTGNLSFNNSRIESDTKGDKPAGNVTITSPDIVTFNNSKIISNTSSKGTAGNILIDANKLNLTDTSEISASTIAEGKAGDITLNASKMNLAGIVGIFAETQGQAPAGTLQLNPYENQPDLDITLFPNSIISASTTAQGKGGDLIITAPENINIAGQGKLAVESTGSGDAGNIFITTQNFNITDGVKISASTSNQGKGGNINLKANTLTATNGAQFLTTTSGSAQAGNINLNIKDNITLDGTNTGLFANTEIGSTGKSGSITIDPQTFIISNGAGIGVNSQGSGEGGDIYLQAGLLTLNNQAFISAETASNQGGNIKLTINDLLLMRNNSRITATAGTAQAGGNGGNITINAPFIVAFPNENSDITANAFEGNGGNINITTNALFGIEFRPQQTQRSDITASSQFGVDGNVQINRPDVDPTQGLVELPTNLVDPSKQIDNSCKPGSTQSQSYFVATGRGGLPLSPTQPLQDTSTLAQWVTPRTSSQNSAPVENQPQASTVTATSPVSPPSIVEASGWVVDANGKIYLVAQAPQVTPSSPGQTSASCSVR